MRGRCSIGGSGISKNTEPRAPTLCTQIAGNWVFQGTLGLGTLLNPTQHGGSLSIK